MIKPDLKGKDDIYLRFAGNDVRHSHFIEFLRDNLLVVEQSKPSVDSARLMSPSFFTYCMTSASSKRMGFEARIESLTPDHQIIIRQLSDPFGCDLRLWRRVRLDLIPGIRAFCQEVEVHIVDISAGGTHIVSRDKNEFLPSQGATVAIEFASSRGERLLEGEVIRQWDDPNGKKHAALQFRDAKDIRQLIY